MPLAVVEHRRKVRFRRIIQYLSLKILHVMTLTSSNEHAVSIPWQQVLKVL